MHLAIRADGDPEIDYRHLSRSGILAEEFLARDHTVTIVTTTPQSAREIFPDDTHTVEFPSRGDSEPFVDWLEAATPSTVFTDSYPIDTKY